MECLSSLTAYQEELELKVYCKDPGVGRCRRLVGKLIAHMWHIQPKLPRELLPIISKELSGIFRLERCDNFEKTTNAVFGIKWSMRAAHI